MATLLDRIVQLLGKRNDDPEVLAFHREQSLPAPPTAWKTTLMYDVKHDTAGYSLNYMSKVRLPELYPPRKEDGRYITYLSSATLKPSFTGELGDELSIALKRKKAKKRALDKWKTSIFRGYVLARRDGVEVVFVYDRDDNSLHEIRVQLEELAPGSKAFKKLKAEAKGRPGRTVRSIPSRTGTPQPEPLPRALEALSQFQDKHGFGDVDFELYEQIEPSGPEAWTGNPEAELEFRVFGGDGSGGLAAFWRIDEGELETQPIVFLGSEGEVGPVAKDLHDFLLLLAAGFGPYEVVAYGPTDPDGAFPRIANIAREYFGPRDGRTADAIVADASAFDDIEDRVEALNQH